jgi:hypothetical protein
MCYGKLPNGKVDDFVKVTQSPIVPRVRGGDPSGVAPRKVEGFFLRSWSFLEAVSFEIESSCPSLLEPVVSGC